MPLAPVPSRRRNPAVLRPDGGAYITAMQAAPNPWPRRCTGIALLALALAGAWARAHLAALSALQWPYAVLLVQALALAAVAGMALLAVPPGLARRAPRGA